MVLLKRRPYNWIIKKETSLEKQVQERWFCSTHKLDIKNESKEIISLAKELNIIKLKSMALVNSNQSIEPGLYC